ncbi:erythromycin esterase family protein [Actinoplanes sp. NPDC049599]|uniref:erythromycin esterase family protein n=1 Tax=Actinoplanes sp. NPDC049599 TaxID=3363903 RepID=UPI0037B28D05
MAENKLGDGAVHPLRTLDPDGAPDDLGWLDEAVGAARVVAVGESAHYHGESYRLRHRLLRHLVDRHGFRAYAMESGFVEGARADEWVRGGDGELGAVLAGGLTSLMGLWQPMRDQLEWLRRHPEPIAFAGIDLPGSNASLLPGLDAVRDYLDRADPGSPVDPALRETAATFAAASAFSAPATIAAYLGLPAERRDALTAGLADLAARLAAGRLSYARRTGAEAYDRALRSMRLTVTLDAVARALARGDQPAMMTLRDAAMADTVEWLLARHERVILAAHNGHIQRVPGTMPGLPPFPTMGTHLADRLGDGYLAIGMTTGTGQTLNTGPDFYTGTLFTELGAPEAGSLDALMEASCDQPFATDLRRLSETDAEAVRGAGRQRFGSYYSDLDPAEAYDLIVHLPHVTAAEPDLDAIAAAPAEVQAAFRSRPS